MLYFPRQRRVRMFTLIENYSRNVFSVTAVTRLPHTDLLEKSIIISLACHGVYECSFTVAVPTMLRAVLVVVQLLQQLGSSDPKLDTNRAGTDYNNNFV